MQLTRAADYAVRVMIHMASLPAGSRVLLSTLAEVTAVPESFLSKVLQALTRAEFVVSRRGPYGGFELSPRSRGASLLDVIEAIDGPVQLNQCLANGRGCEHQDWCAAHLVWIQAQEAMLNVLKGASIAQLATQSTTRKAAVTGKSTEEETRDFPLRS